MSNKNKTVIRTMELINLFIEQPELTFQEIVDLSGVPKSSAFRMISSLEEMGFLEKGEDNKYRLGTVFLKLGQLVSSRLNIRNIASSVMKSLHEKYHQAVNLAILEGHEAVYVEKIDHYQRVKLYTSVGRRSPLYGGACARAILSFLPDREIENYLENINLIPYSPRTIVKRDELWETIKEARKNGYTVSKSELEAHTASVASPIFDYAGKVIGSISIAGIENDFSKEKVIEFGAAVKKAANIISKEMGYIAE